MLSSGVTDRVLERGQPAAQLSSMATAPLRSTRLNTVVDWSRLAPSACRWVGDATHVMAMSQVVVKERVDPGSGVLKTVEVPDHLDVLARMACGAQAHMVFSAATGEWCVCVGGGGGGALGRREVLERNVLPCPCALVLSAATGACLRVSNSPGSGGGLRTWILCPAGCASWLVGV